MTIRSRSVFAGLVGIGGLFFAAGCNQAELDQANKAAEAARQGEATAKGQLNGLQARVAELQKQLEALKAATPAAPAATTPAAPQAAVKPAAQPAASAAPAAAKPAAKPAAAPATKPVADAVTAPATSQPRDPQALAAELARQEQEQREAASAEMQARLALDGLSEDADPAAAQAAQDKLRSAAKKRQTAAASLAALRQEKAAAESSRSGLAVE